MILRMGPLPLRGKQLGPRSRFFGCTDLQRCQRVSLPVAPPSRTLVSVQGKLRAPNIAALLETYSSPIRTFRSECLLCVASGRKCELTGKKANNGYNVTFSHIRNKKLQQVNLQYKKVYWPEAKRVVRLRLSTKVRLCSVLPVSLSAFLFGAHKPCFVWQAIKTLEKKGLQVMAKEAGIDLYKLPYTDVSPARKAWLAEHHKGNPAQPSKIGKSRRMKNPEKLAASQKRPLQARYLAGGRVILTRDPKYVEEYQG